MARGKSGRARPRSGRSGSAQAGSKPLVPPRPTKSERIAAQRRAQQVRRWRNTLVAVVIVAGLVGAITFAVVSGARRRARLHAALTAHSCRADSMADPGENHVAGVTYRVIPPAGGDHDPSPAPSGFYTTDNDPGDPHVVHSLQHGYVVIWYRPGLSSGDVDQLRTLVDQYTPDVLVVPEASMSVPVAATAWHHRLLCGQVEPPTLAKFVTTYRNKGPERVPHQ